MSSSPSPPAAPDPAATAAAQSTSNVNTAAAQSALNYINQNTPYGSTDFQQTGSYTTPSGQVVPTYTQNTSLSPLGQGILTGTQETATNLLPSAFNLSTQAGQAANTPLNFNTPFSGMINSGPQSIGSLNSAYAPTLNAGPQLLNQNVTNAIYGQQKSFLDPQWNLQQTQLQDQLSRQGIPVGSDAYNNAMGQLTNARTQAYQSAQDSAIGQGTGAASNLFNMALTGQGQDTARQQAMFNSALQGQTQNIGQQTLAQQQPLSLLQAMFGAVPGTPQQPISQPAGTSVAPTDVIGSTALSQNAANQAFQANLAASNAQTGGEAALAGTAITAGAIVI